MTDAPSTLPKAPRDRSPSFPFIPLKMAIERLQAFEAYFGRHPTPTGKAGLAWKMKEKSSQADQTLAALRSFGLIRYTGSGTDRHASLTDDGRNYLRTQQESVRHQILKQGALRPRIIRKFWTTWGPDRPPDPVALDQLYAEGFSDGGAANFLRVYDETIAYAGLSESDKIPFDGGGEGEQDGDESSPLNDLPPPPPEKRKVLRVMEGERELTTGMLAKDANFRLIVSGKIGVKEIERLIRKLELDKEILADQGDDETEPDVPARKGSIPRLHPRSAEPNDDDEAAS